MTDPVNAEDDLVEKPTDPAEMLGIAEAVSFYADPENWHGVYMVGDGPMADDWSDVAHPQYPDGKPGKRAREAIDAYLNVRAALEAVRSTRDGEIERLTALLRRVEPHLDAIICYASTMGEHEPNRIAHDVRQALNQGTPNVG